MVQCIQEQGGYMAKISREQVVGLGALGTFFVLFGLSSMHEQPSVAQAALTLLNNPRESALYQTIPPETDTPTPELSTATATPTPSLEDPTLTPTPTSENSTSTPTPTATTTPENQTPIPTETNSSRFSVNVFDATFRPVKDLPVYIQKENPPEIATLHTNLIGHASAEVADGQTITISTEGPNNVADALYFLETNSETFNQVIVSHDEGEHLSTSASLTTADQPIYASAAYLNEEPTATPDDPTATPIVTNTPSPTETPQGPTATPAPTPESSPLAPDLFIGGVVMADVIAVDSNPDGTSVEVTDFDSSGSITLDRADLNLTHSSGFHATTSVAQNGNYDVTVYSAEPDTDGFTLSVTTNGSVATARIEPEIFTSGSLDLNTAIVAQAIENGQGNQAQLPISVDRDNNGVPEQTLTVPAEVTEVESFSLFLPSVKR